jgi:hypothetical protein
MGGFSALIAIAAIAASVAFASRGSSPSAVAGSAGPPPTTTTTTPPTTVPMTVEERCADALQWVATIGLPLPAGVGYRCPSTVFAHHGASCWYAAQCPNGRFIAINAALMGDVSQTYFRYVVAHEICHMRHFDAGRSSTEPEADACAAAHGARPG